MKAMGDRQDIDALLVGALYGELDSDDRARLDAHLASHPGDRAALDGLRSTREALRDSGVSATFGEEPSAAISARLLQEAARRAPAPRLGEGVLGFLASLFRPVSSHPALSAAAALVLVIGIGSLMMKNGRMKAAQPEVQTAAHDEPVRAADPATIAPPAIDTPPGGFPVGLQDNANAQTDGESAPRQLAQNGDALRERKLDTHEAQQQFHGKDAAPRPAASKPNAKPGSLNGYMEVDKRATGGDLAMADPDGTNAGEAATGANRPVDAVSSSRDETRRQSAGSSAVAGAAPRASAAPPSIAPSPAPVDPGAATETLKKEAENNAWARDQHARMVKLVNAGKCTEAGQIGAEIARKAPEYYQSTVANDRAVRSCQAYVDRARRAKAPAPAKSKAGNQQPDARADDLEQVK